MCVVIGTTAALVLGGSAALGAGASIYGANKAAGAEKSSTNAAISQEQQALNQQEKLAGPYTGLGQSAIPQLQALLGLGSGKGNSASELTALQQTPGYQFTQQQGNQATLNAATATGMLGSGNTLEALDKFNTGLADQTYQNAVQNAQGAVGLGQAAAAGQAANIGQTAGEVGSQLTSEGGNIAGLDTNLAASLAGIGGNVANAYTLQQTLAGLNNPGLTPTDYATLQGGGVGPTMSAPGGYTLNTPG